MNDFPKRFSQGISACVINHNGESYLQETLRSVCEQKESFKEILLIDNASEDRSIPLVRELFPDVRVIPLKTNAGPGAARNAGFQNAACHRILFLDNDIRITAETPALLAQSLDEFPGAALAMPGIRYEGRGDVIQFDGAGCHYLGLMTLHHQDMSADGVSTDVRKIDTLVTSCFMIDLCRVGDDLLFDESFFFNYEDFDFGLRARIRGHEVLSVPEATGYHRGGTPGLSYRNGESYPRNRIIFLMRNRWQIILKCYGLKTLFFLFPILLIYEFFQFLGVVRKRWFTEWLQSVSWILSNRHEIMRKRDEVQRKRIRKDREILKNGPLPFIEGLPRGKIERWGIKVLNRLTAWYWCGVKHLI